MRQPPLKVRLAAIRTAILCRPWRLLAIVAIAVAGALVDRLLLDSGDVWGAIAAFGAASWLGSGWVQRELVSQTPGESPEDPRTSAG